MRKEIVIRMYVNTEKGQTKAMKVAATVSGVESVSLAGGDKNLLLVIGEGVDSNKLSKKLKKKVGAAEIVELRTVDTFEAAVMSSPYYQTGTKAGAMAMAAAAARSPYNNNNNMHQYQYGGAQSPYTYHHYPSPMDYARGGGYGYGGSTYSRVVALSHPANYSPLVEKHDYYPMDHRSSVGSGTPRAATPRTGAATPRAGAATTKTTSYRSVPRRQSGSSGGCCIQ